MIVPEDRRDELGGLLKRISAGEHVEHYETFRLRKDGQQVPVSLTMSPIHNNLGQVVGISTIAHDITLLKQNEQALRAANAYNRSLIEASLDPLVTIGAGGKITDVNAATEQITGCPRSELIGADFSDYFTEPEKARAGYQQVFRDGAVQNYALEIRHRDGHITPVLYNASVFRDAQGNVAGVFAAARDITEQKRAEQALQQLNQGLEVRVAERTKELVSSEERFAKAFQANPTAMVITELAGGKIVDVNESYLKLFKFSREEMLGHTAAELKLISSPGEREKPMQILREQGKVNNYATPLRLKSGEIRYALVSQEKIELEGRACVLSSLNDITTHKEAEDALRESEQRFKAIADHTPDHILMQDRDLRYTLVVNPQVGLTEKDMLGKTDVEILGWEDAEKLTSDQTPGA